MQTHEVKQFNWLHMMW